MNYPCNIIFSRFRFFNQEVCICSEFNGSDQGGAEDVKALWWRRRSKLYGVSQDNRELFLCAFEEDPKSAMIWLRNKMGLSGGCPSGGIA
ncbi:hypothetical protein EJB05_00785, partial [Eragrostis curvula]